MGGGKGGADVKYSQSPEQRAVYQALTPLIQRLGEVYGTTGSTGRTIQPTMSQFPQTPSEWQSQKWWDTEQGRVLTYSQAQRKGFEGLTPYTYLTPTSTPRVSTPSTTTPSTTTATTPQQSLYQIPAAPTIPSPDIMSPLTAYNFVAPQVQAGLWQPYQEAERRLLDVLQSRGQLGAPGAGVSGAAAAGLGEFYSQAARDIGLGTYQMSLPFTQMAQQPLSQYWGAQTGQLGDIWQAELQRQMMPWQMLPGLLGGSYPTGIAQQGNSLASALGGGLMAGGTGYALGTALEMSNPWILGASLAGGSMLGGK